jgi:hypothetical protein
MPVRGDTARVTGFIRFSADDFRSLAQAARVAAAQADVDASNQSNPSIVRQFNDSAMRYRELAEKCENAARVK